MDGVRKNIIFFLKCILAVLPFIILVLFTWLDPMGYMDEEYPSWRYVKDVQKGSIDTAGGSDTTLILGDSRAMADIVPDQLGDSYVNLGMGGATSVEMYYTLKAYIENNGAPSRVFIMFAPFHYSYMDNYRTRSLYFHHLSFLEAAKVYRTTLTLSGDGQEESIDEVDPSYIISSYLRLPNVYLPALINAKGIGRSAVNKELYDEQVENRGHALYGKLDYCDDLNYEASYTEMKRGREHRLITRYFSMLLKLCSDNDIETTVLQAPMNEASYNELKENYVNEYQSYMRQFATDNKKVDFELDIPCYDNSYFGDSSHLNERGAAAYTQELLYRYIK